MNTITARNRIARYDPAELTELPDAVQRYFRFALMPGQPLIRMATIEHTGWFTMKLGGTPVPFTSVERFWTAPPGFEWDARMRIARTIGMRVRDTYRDGTGGIEARVAGIPVMRRRGTPELASGTLIRWLAEAVWVPTALLPASGVTWTKIDDTVARATLTDAGTTVALNVRFGPDGEIMRTSAERYRNVKGRSVLTPWHGYFANYERMDGMMIPTTGWVEWVLPEGRLAYWRGRIVGYRAELASACGCFLPSQVSRPSVLALPGERALTPPTDWNPAEGCL